MTIRHLLAVYRNRPEAIKMAPLLGALSRDARFRVTAAVTAQHREMLDQVNDLFGIVPEHDLDMMVPGAGLADLSSRALVRLADLISDLAPDAVVVQGDTSTAFVAALAAFYAQVPVIHLEAGLRTGNLSSPFPEEGNRQLISRLADLHLAPTGTSRANLLAEGIKPDRIAVTGNTVIDALVDAVGRPVDFADARVADVFDTGRPVVLITAHRRESWGDPMREAMGAVGEFATSHPAIEWVLPMHRNPVVRDVVEPLLGGLSNVLLTEPLSYHEFCHAMRRSRLLLTDSGGVQEEAPSLGKPVLVMRDTTERPEAVAAGTVRLVGTSAHAIEASLSELLLDERAYAAMANAVNPYGDGHAAQRATAAIAEMFGMGERLPDFEPAERELDMFDRGVAVIGLGYIGLPTSAAIAMQGITVVGVDVNPSTVDAVNEGRIPIVEPELDVAVAGAHAKGLLRASLEVPEADAFLIAVPTPFAEGNVPDLSYVQAAAEMIAPKLTGGEVVILESTSPPGTTRKVSEWIAAARPDLKLPHEAPDNPDVHVAHCPERVLPGRIMIELVTNDRVIGGLTPACAKRAADVYALFCRGELLFSDAESAEMAKLVENSYRDVNIAFANELASVADHMGLDVWEIIRLANRHPRVNVLQPGPGVGGHCIAVDPWFIVAGAPEQARMIRLAREINDGRPRQAIEAAVELASGDTAPVACLGLSFKADIDDLRESPAVTVVEGIAGALPHRRVLVVEPHVDSLPESLRAHANVEQVTLAEAMRESTTLVLLVDHQQFRRLGVADLRSKKLLDTRGIWSTRSI